jgi:hypothetical protein
LTNRRHHFENTFEPQVVGALNLVPKVALPSQFVGGVCCWVVITCPGLMVRCAVMVCIENRKKERKKENCELVAFPAFPYNLAIWLPSYGRWCVISTIITS